MKKVFLFAVLASVMVACGGKTTEQSVEVDSTQVESVVDSTAVQTEETLDGTGVSAGQEVTEPVSEQPVK